MRRRQYLIVATVAVAILIGFGRFTTGQSNPPAAGQVVPMPNKSGSLKFAVLGDFGTGEPEQYQMAAQIAKTYAQFKFELMILVGDNLYGAERPQDFEAKFEKPYKPLLDGGVLVKGSLGNHDAREQVKYAPFNMDGKRYYSFKAAHENVRFYALESTYPEPDQILWFEKELKNTNEDWKIAF